MKEIKNTTIYNQKNLKKFLEFFYKEKLRVPRIVINILIVVMVINFFTKNSREVMDYLYLIIALLGILELNTNFIPRFNYYKMTKNKKNNMINTKIDYVFKKNNFKISTNKDEYIDYNTLKKVLETKEYYYLYLNNYKAFIVDKTSLNSKEIEEITNRFKENAAYKYKNV